MSASRIQEIMFEPEKGKLIATNGGTYHLDKQEYIETTAFNTSSKSQDGGSVRYEIEREQATWRQRDLNNAERVWQKR